VALIALAVGLVVLRLLIRGEVGVERSEFMRWLTGIRRLSLVQRREAFEALSGRRLSARALRANSDAVRPGIPI
jgi:hypothetical protein